MPVKLKRLRCCYARTYPFFAIICFDRCDKCGLVSAAHMRSLIENSLQIICCRRLAFCACNSDYLKTLRNIVKHPCNRRHGISYVFYNNTRNFVNIVISFTHISYTAVFDGILEKLLLKCGAFAHEKAAVFSLSRIVCNRCNRLIASIIQINACNKIFPLEHIRIFT